MLNFRATLVVTKTELIWILAIALKRKLLITFPSATFGRAGLIVVMSLSKKLMSVVTFSKRELFCDTLPRRPRYLRPADVRPRISRCFCFTGSWYRNVRYRLVGSEMNISLRCSTRYPSVESRLRGRNLHEQVCKSNLYEGHSLWLCAWDPP